MELNRNGNVFYPHDVHPVTVIFNSSRLWGPIQKRLPNAMFYLRK